jgi:methylmalonyl-CoA/ethylmalonyl-CoA epimerase
MSWDVRRISATGSVTNLQRDVGAGSLSGLDHVALLVPDADAALPELVDHLGLHVLSDETLLDPAVRLVHLDAGNVDLQLVQPTGPGRVADDLARTGPGLHHVCFGVPSVGLALELLGDTDEGAFTGGSGRRACFLSHRPSALYVELIESGDGDSFGSFTPATERVIAYWVDECKRDLEALLTHFTADAVVVTMDGSYQGTQAIRALYQDSFDAFPGLQVDLVARYSGRGTHCFEFSAVLTDPAGVPHLVEGVNVLTLEGGMIAHMRSYENAPRPMASGGPAEPRRQP